MQAITENKSEFTIIIARFGWCQHCHKKFEPNIDRIKLHKRSKKAYHLNCEATPLPWSEKKQTIENAASTETTSRKSIQSVKTKTDIIESQVLSDVSKLFDGRFTIPCKLNNEETYLTVSITTAKAHHKYPGSRLIKIHFGRHDKKLFIRAAFITTKGEFHYYKSFNEETDLSADKKRIAKAAIQMLLTGQENEVYALEFARICKECWHCGKPLINDHTLQMIEQWKGLGPVCHKKYPELANRITEETKKVRPTMLD